MPVEAAVATTEAIISGTAACGISVPPLKVMKLEKLDCQIIFEIPVVPKYEQFRGR
jgi:hypothetical protein